MINACCKKHKTARSKIKHKRKVCIKAVDVFGFESVVITENGNDG